MPKLICSVFGIQMSNIFLCKLMCVAVFAIQKSNICVSKLMCVLFLCARQWSMIKEAEKDYEEEEENEEEEDE